jgi:hypothetical protein
VKVIYVQDCSPWQFSGVDRHLEAASPVSFKEGIVNTKLRAPQQGVCIVESPQVKPPSFCIPQ